jgi:hypothetical protein
MRTVVIRIATYCMLCYNINLELLTSVLQNNMMRRYNIPFSSFRKEKIRGRPLHYVFAVCTSCTERIKCLNHEINQNNILEYNSYLTENTLLLEEYGLLGCIVV